MAHLLAMAKEVSVRYETAKLSRKEIGDVREERLICSSIDPRPVASHGTITVTKIIRANCSLSMARSGTRTSHAPRSACNWGIFPSSSRRECPPERHVAVAKPSHTSPCETKLAASRPEKCPVPSVVIPELSLAKKGLRSVLNP
jgi:hypothetical protein